MPHSLPSLNALRAFEAVGRLGSMTAAAAELHVTHGAVSRQIKRLEAHLGVALLEGPKQALRLTPMGRELLDGLTPGFEHLEQAVRRVTDDVEGTLDVTCLGTLMLRWLIPRLHRFQAAHPAIEVRLSASDGPLDLERARFDVAIHVDGAWRTGAEVTPLFTERVGPVMAPAFHSGDRPRLEAMTLLHTATRPHAWRDWAKAAGVGLMDLRGPTYEHFYFLLEAAVAGLGACIAPWILVVDDIRAGRLVAPYGFLPSGLEYVVLRPPRSSRKAALFRDWLVEEGERFRQESAPPEAPHATSRSPG
ncbi:LysR substrate-binding domain-containing protein [Halomonas sp. McH1-25]|uniref:LysR substrate-binding domain-containing protein n=1 Tax=unclassified Halomonas TaxID=2609666 RepID=UPI001EF47427|nr:MULTISPECIES: LysR substrate-binding domain-containing protein [unclassified Halomonas]MCG7599320.1 LysR substrate-binding domain-containing protein [Halomonas sp. McH1-25]MCP1341188.1 LysR substrate-binding domain-containing protein [Halomonas sp. FL8]MCP1362094.1 LysR substrate-binding domain-containing protein [Halomonas sp. BBD45]